MTKKGTHQTEQQILQAAEEEFMQKGFSGARTTEIARRAGVGHPLLHYYFRTKEQLFERIFQEKFATFSQQLLSTVNVESTSVVDKVCAIMAQHFDFLCDNVRLPLFIVNSFNELPEFIDKIKHMQQLASLIFARIQNELDAAADRGEIVKVDAFTLIFDAFSLNIAVFMFSPVIGQMASVFNLKLDKFYEQRKQENMELIRKRLKP